MKITYIANVRLPTEKAHGLQIIKSCEAFVNAGVDVDLYVSNRLSSISNNEFEYYDVPKSFNIFKIECLDIFYLENILGRICFWVQTFSFLNNLNKVVIAKEDIIYTRNVEIAWLFSNKGYEVVYEAHSWPQSKGKLMKLLLKRVSFIICNSKGTQNKFISMGYKNTLAVANGVDLNMFANFKLNECVFQELKTSIENKIIMYTGHLYKWKGIDVIIEAAKLWRDKPGYLFVLVGGTKKDLEKYTNIIKENNLKNVKLTGHCDPNLIPSYLTLADVLVLPNVPISEESVNYTSPLKLFEYMTTNKPIVASKLPSICEILNSNNAVLVEPNNPLALLTGVELVVNDDNLATKISSQAKADVVEYSWNKRVEKIIWFLKNV